MSRISAASSAAASPFSDGGLAVVRIKPLGAGGGGGERSATSGRAALHATSRGIRVGDSGGRSGGNAKVWTYPQHVIAPEDDQEALYEKFVPQRISTPFSMDTPSTYAATDRLVRAKRTPCLAPPA